MKRSDSQTDTADCSHCVAEPFSKTAPIACDCHFIAQERARDFSNEIESCGQPLNLALTINDVQGGTDGSYGRLRPGYLETDFDGYNHIISTPRIFSIADDQPMHGWRSSPALTPGIIRSSVGPNRSGISNIMSVQECFCMACLSVGVPQNWEEGMLCRFPDCVSTTSTYGDYITHERDHFHQSGSPLFVCLEEHCTFDSKRWPDLIRHYKVRHCKKPREFPCPVPWCKFSGSNGFARKDKMTSHYNNIHRSGLTAPRKAFRVIKAASIDVVASRSNEAGGQK